MTRGRRALVAIVVAAWSVAAHAEVALSLDEAIAVARQRRAEMSEAQIEIERARLRLLSAQLAFADLRVSGHGEAGIELGDTPLPGPGLRAAALYSGAGPLSGTLYDAGIDGTLEIPIWSGWRNESKLKAARLRSDGAAARARSAALAVMLDVARAYWAVRRGELLHEAIATELAQYREIEQLTQRQASVGVAAPYDYNRVRAEALSIEARLRSNERELVAARARLASALAIDDTIRLTDDPPSAAPEISSRAEAEREALAAHPELAAATADERAAAADVTAAKGAYWPQLSLVGQATAGVGLPGLPTATPTTAQAAMSLSSPTQTTWYGLFGGAQLTWPLFDMLGAWTQVREAELRRRSVAVERSRLRQLVLTNVRAAHAELLSAAAQVTPIRQAVALARNNVDLARRRYSAGSARLFEVLDAERELVRIEQALIDSTVILAEANVQLRAALGRL